MADQGQNQRVGADDGRVRQHHRPPAAAARRHLRPAAPAQGRAPARAARPAGAAGQQGGQQGQGQPGQQGQRGQGSAGQGQGQGEQAARVSTASRARAVSEQQRALKEELEKLRASWTSWRQSDELDRRARPWRTPSARSRGRPRAAPGEQATRSSRCVRARRRWPRRCCRAARRATARTATPRDPLGRPQRFQGPDAGNSVKVPDQIDMQRAREILEELRRRLAQPTRPPMSSTTSSACCAASDPLSPDVIVIPRLVRGARGQATPRQLSGTA